MLAEFVSHWFAQSSGPGASHIASMFLSNLGTWVTTYVNNVSSAVIGYIGPLGFALLSIYVIVWGIMLASGMVSEPFTDAMKRVVRMVGIVVFALGAGAYQGDVAKFFLKLPSEFGLIVLQGAAGSVPSGGGGANCTLVTIVGDESAFADMIDQSITCGYQIPEKIAQYVDENLKDWSSIPIAFYLDLIAFISGLLLFLMAAVATGMLFVAYTILAIMLAIGPFFILGLLFDKTQSFFESWLRQVTGLVFQFVVIAAALGLVISFLGSFVNTLDMTNYKQCIANGLKLMGFCFVALIVFWQSQSIGSALGSAVTISIGQSLRGMGRDGAMATNVARQVASPAIAARRAAAAGAQSTYQFARRVFSRGNTVSQG